MIEGLASMMTVLVLVEVRPDWSATIPKDLVERETVDKDDSHWPRVLQCQDAAV